MLDPQLVASLAPPLVGALAGYGSSHLALSLLFKPRKPWRIFKLRLPLTPGAFALGRPRFAAAIGKAIGNRLLYRPAIERVLADPRFKAQLRQDIASRTDDLLHHDLGPAASLVTERFRPVYEMSGKVMRLRFQQLLHAHLDSPAFAESLQRELERHGIPGKPPTGEILTLLRSSPGKRLIDTLLAELFTAKVLAQPIGPLAKLLPAEVQAGLDELLAREAELILTGLLPEVVAALNFQATATQQVEALDPHQYEALLRSALGRRVNFIALLGALLGLGLGLLPLLPPVFPG